ncbi:MAG: carbohydrate ABC transporter permease [candidate division NC10 bacterium]|nr:carbohydrate ABC transporter permease [candidate division NC10 bacterium]MBI2564350.1 carbohydrate ABC transporter permease [candidate division NC10 bacterium]
MRRPVALLLAGLACWAVGPLYLMLKVSVSPPGEVMTARPTLLPHGLTLEHWRGLLDAGQVLPPLGKSLVTAGLVAAAALLLAAPAAYNLARLPARWRYGILLGLFLVRMLPEVSIALPVAVVFLRWGLMDSVTGLVLAHLTLVLPVVAWVLTTTFLAIPREVEEAAALDGCSAWQTLWRVTLRLAVPGLVVAGLLAWLFSWEEFLLATYLTLGAKTMPLQVYYYLYQGNWFLTAAAATLMTAPVLLLTGLLQRHLRATWLAGAVR